MSRDSWASQVLAAALLIWSAAARGAELKQVTLDAWDQYLHAADAQMTARATGTFLWADESAERVGRVRSGK